MIPDLNDFCSPSDRKQKLEEKAAKAQEALDKETKAHKELQALFNKVQQEKNDLSSVLEGEKGNLADVHEKTNKLKAQKADLEAQLNVSFYIFLNSSPIFIQSRKNK
jgi:predicted  nucleic acid-binding Zn-ribbon protein